MLKQKTPGAKFMFMFVLALLPALAFPGPGAWGDERELKGNFCLIDRATQVPVLGCDVPSGWCAGGKTTWTSEPAQPVHWYVWCANPDGSMKVVASSAATLVFPATIVQIPILQDPTALAEVLREGLAKDYALPDLRTAGATFRDPGDAGEAQALLQSRPGPGARMGIMVVSDLRLWEFEARYSGTRGGEPFSVIIGIPVLVTELRSNVAVTTMVELLGAGSCGCAEGKEEETAALRDAFLRSVSVNPGFSMLVGQIIEDRTRSWLQTQQEIRDIQMGVYQGQSESQDRIRSRWSDYIRDVAVVEDPASGQSVALDARYDHARIGSDGSVLYYNDGFNPNSNTAMFDPNANPLFNGVNWGEDLMR